MAREIIDEPIENLDSPWENYKGKRVREFIQGKLTEHETSLGQTVKGVRVNTTPVPKDANGMIDLNIPPVDSSLNTGSTNPVENGVVATEINGLKQSAVANMRTEPHPSDPDSLMLIIENENGDEVTSCAIPKASEGGNQTYPRVTVSVSKNRIKRGDSVVLTWTYNHYNGDGTPTGTAAETVTIRVVNGTTETYREVLSNIPDNTTRQLTLGSDVLTAGTIGIYVTAVVMDEGGNEQRAQGYKAVQVVTIDLTSTADPAAFLAFTDGYTDGQTIDIPFVITGPRGSSVTMWLDGEQYDTTTINSSSATMGHFYIQASTLAAGRHNVQIVAESDGLLSNVIWCDIRKAGSNDPYLGLKMTLSADLMNEMPLAYENGSEVAIPISVEQFSDLIVSFGAWNSASNTSTVIVAIGGQAVQTLAVGRTLEELSQRFDTAGASVMTLSLGNEERTLNVSVIQAQGIDEHEIADYYIKLTAAGRSNNEQHPDNWGGITTFENVDWNTSGWVKKDGVDTLNLSNGARAVIGYAPFELLNEYSIAGNGMTVEMEVMVSQVLERGARVMSCLELQPNNAYLGFDITTVEAGLHLGQMQTITTAETDEHGDPIVIQRELGVSMDIAHDRWMKVAFVMQSTSEGRKVFLYINGVLSKANRYDQGLNLVQSNPVGIAFDSEKADIAIRMVRIYRRALTRGEILSNYIVDRPTAAEVQAKHLSNVTSEGGSTLVVDPQTLISKGRGVLVIYGKDIEDETNTRTILQLLYSKNNKNYDAKADYVRWYSPLGRNFDFEVYNNYLRIQGTSSTKYPWKNLRIYLNKGPKTEEEPLRLLIGGVETSTLKYPLRGATNSVAQSVLCAKTDFVDSSMTLNTGGAKLFDNIMRTLGLLTPPQAYDARVRQAIDGIPCDVFCAREVGDPLVYYGQYNLNNEKSKSGELFGMEKVKDSGGNNVVWDCPIALEALNNGSPMTLFQPAGSASSAELEAQLMQYFDDGFEFNFPEDTFYNPAKISDPSKESEASAAQKTALKRWLGWIYDVTPSDMRTNPEYGDRYGWTAASKAKWVSTRFKNEASQYFDINHLLTYYLIIDYLAGVDQRAKNIIWRTWDGYKWYSTFYDGDTAEGIRNDAFIAYLYNVTRDTWDDERAKYAFEGHDSWLWCLVLANFEDELKQCAANLRSAMNTAVLLSMFNDTIMGNWSERQYNESQMLKYVDTMPVADTGYVYTLTGNREAHRTAFYTDRGQLLDARYAAGGYSDDNIGLYVGRNSSDANDVIVIKSGDLYYFGWRLANGGWRYGPIKAENNEVLNIPINGTLQVNDPIALCGASRIRELDLTNMLQGHLKGNLNIGKCAMLSKLLMSATPNGVNGGVTISLGSITKLEYVDLTGQTSTGTNQSGNTLDMSAQGRLHTLLCGGTHLQIVNLPEGSPLSTLVLPDTLTTLSLRYLTNLLPSGLTLQGTANITTFNFAACPHLDWQTLLASCPNVQYIRVEGITGKVHYSFLRQFLDKRGIDENGNQITYPALVGSVTLMEVITEEEMTELGRFRDLDIQECQYSVYEINDAESDPACVTNLENNTSGYDIYDPETGELTHQGYLASGHAKKVRDKMKPYFGHLDENTGKWTGFRVSDTNYKQDASGNGYNYSDSTGEGNDLMMLLPHCWYKGINDFKSQKKYICWSALDTRPQSSASRTVRYSLNNAETEAALRYGTSVGVRVNNITVNESMIDDEGVIANVGDDASTFNVYRIDVGGMKQIRWPGVNRANYGVCFTDESGLILRKWNLSVNDNDFDFNMSYFDYLFLNVLEGEKYCYITAPNGVTSSADGVIIVTDSEEVEAIEPDWVEHKQCLVGVYQASWVDNRLRSLTGKTVKRGDGTSTTGNWSYNDETGDQYGTFDGSGNKINSLPSTLHFTMKDFQNVSRRRGQGYQLIDYEMSKFVAILFYCIEGNLNSQAVCGSGYPTDTGRMDAIGNRNTRPTEFLASGNYYYSKCLGLESFFSSYVEWMDNCCINRSSYELFYKGKMTSGGSAVNGRWSIFNPDSMDLDGNGNQIKQRFNTCPFRASTTDTGGYIKRVRHGRYCDLVPSMLAGTSMTRYCDYYYYSTGGRVLGRAYYGIAYGGVAFASAGYASSVSDTGCGSRLAFRGEIEVSE